MSEKGYLAWIPKEEFMEIASTTINGYTPVTYIPYWIIWDFPAAHKSFLESTLHWCKHSASNYGAPILNNGSKQFDLVLTCLFIR